MTNVCDLLLNSSLDTKYQQVIANKLINKPNEAIKPKEMELMLKMGRKVSTGVPIQD